MKSTNYESRPFSMEDFEKGLMLAGLISPSTVDELKEREIIENYQKEEKASKKAEYFKRAVLAAKIASDLHEQSTFGRVKFQKLVYLCEHVAKLQTEHRYQKFAAGPFDNKFMHSIEKEFSKQKWFRVEKVKKGTMTRSTYFPLEGCEKFRPYYNRYFHTTDNTIQYIIDLFKDKKTAFTEIAATLAACYFEILDKNEIFSEDLLLNKFYAWSEQKQKFSPTDVSSVWQWVKDKNIIVISDK
jgi:hypothetical protein